MTYPPAEHEDFFVSGFARGEEELGGTAAVVDEPFGDGRVVLFASDPNFRAWTVGMQKVLRNAILGADPAAARAATASRPRAGREDRSRAGHERLRDPAHRHRRDVGRGRDRSARTAARPSPSARAAARRAS